VRDKLYNLGLHQEEVEEMISKLIVEGFINEERFARGYVRGKYRLKKWGRIKIKIGLDAHRLSDYCIKKGFAEIDEEEYLENLRHLAVKKLPSIKGDDAFTRKLKLQNFLQGKGYEYELIREVIDPLDFEKS